MSNLCNFEKLFLWQSIAQTSLFTWCFCISHKCRSICNHWERVCFFFLLMPVSLSQKRGTVGMFNIILANERCNKNSICYRKKTQSCEFGLTMILFILLHAFPTLIGFLKKIARPNILTVHIDKKFLISYFYLFLSCSYLYHNWLFPRLMDLSFDI